MSRIDKKLEKMRQNRLDWFIEELKIIADRYNIEYRQPGISHVTFRFPDKQKLTVTAHKPIKPIYIKQFIDILDEQGGENEAS